MLKSIQMTGNNVYSIEAIMIGLKGLLNEHAMLYADDVGSYLVLDTDTNMGWIVQNYAFDVMFEAKGKPDYQGLFETLQPYGWEHRASLVLNPNQVREALGMKNFTVAPSPASIEATRKYRTIIIDHDLQRGMALMASITLPFTTDPYCLVMTHHLEGLANSAIDRLIIHQSCWTRGDMIRLISDALEAYQETTGLTNFPVPYNWSRRA